MRKSRKILVCVCYYHLFFDLTVLKPLFCFIFCFVPIQCLLCVKLEHPLFWKSFMHFRNEIASIVLKQVLSFISFFFCQGCLICIHLIIVMTLTMIDEFKMNVLSMLDSHFYVSFVFLFFVVSHASAMDGHFYNSNIRTN